MVDFEYIFPSRAVMNQQLSKDIFAAIRFPFSNKK